jgi:hypothetical protein
MAEHSLAIHRFRTRLTLTGLREDAPPLGREVSRAVQEVLPVLLGSALEPLLGSREGVLRIDRLALRLRLGRGELSAVKIADLLAGELAQAVATRAEGGGSAPRTGAGLAYWPDHALYAASYIAHRLRLVPISEWAFPDFRALAHLAPHEAALELFAARPEILAASGRLLGAATAAALADALPEPTAALLIRRLVADFPAALPQGADAELAQLIASLPAAVEAAPGRTAVAATITALAGLSASDPETVRRIAMLARIAVALTALRAAILPWGRLPSAEDLAAAAFLHLPEPTRRLAQEVLAPLTDAEPVRARLIRALDSPQPRRPAARANLSTLIEPAAEGAPRAITSRLAGIGILMPIALTHGLPELLSPAALHRTLAAAAGSEAEPAARLDPVLAALAPFDPRGPEPMFPPVPAALRRAVPGMHREGAAESEGAVGWAACLVHAFAGGLAHFETSSLAYLRRQFLARPGTLHIDRDRLTLVLDPLPLGIVLRVSALHGWTGQLPQARNALLRIEVREG